MFLAFPFSSCSHLLMFSLFTAVPLALQHTSVSVYWSEEPFVMFAILCFGNEDAPSSVSDVDRCFIIRKLLDSIIFVQLIFMRRREIKTYLRGTFLP
jgi:hypothetical protein